MTGLGAQHRQYTSVRVWDSETTLCFLLLQEPQTITSTLNISSLWELRQENNKLRVLELGVAWRV
jgi:hypothetical protein